MFDKFVGPADILKFREANLRDNSTELATGGRNTVSGGPVARREDFSRYNEGCRVRPKVLEKVCETV